MNPIVFHEGKNHGIKQHRADVEEMAVQHTGGQQCQYGNKCKHLFAGKPAQEKRKGLDAVKNVGRNANDAAGGKDLNDGIVPSCREKGHKLL